MRTQSSRLPGHFQGNEVGDPPLRPPHDRWCSHEPRLPLVHGEGRGLERGCFVTHYVFPHKFSGHSLAWEWFSPAQYLLHFTHY